MKTRNLTLTALLFLASGAAIAKAPDFLSPEYVLANLTKDVTTRADVIRLFGEPVRRQVRVSSDSGSIEYLVYTNNPPRQAERPRRKGTGLGGLLRSARGVAGDVAAVTGRNYYGSDTADALRRAEHAANAVDRVSAAAATSEDYSSQESGDPPLSLTIELRNGVVTHFELGE